MEFLAPQRGQKAFTCPHCGVLAQQSFFSANLYLNKEPRQDEKEKFVATSFCVNCNEYALWHKDLLVWPAQRNAPFPNPDMPDDVKKDYEEAAMICTLSPKGAAGLLRLCVQKLCVHLGEDGKNINDDIASLVRKGLSPKIQQALDVVRVVGNNAVHPGPFDADNADVVNSLFGIINVIVETMITIPKNISTLYTSLPAANLAAIQNRDTP